MVDTIAKSEGRGGRRANPGRKKKDVSPSQRESIYNFTFKPFYLWLVEKGIKKSAFARVHLGIKDSLFTHWLKSKDPPISTFFKIIEGSGGELRIEDFIVDKRFSGKVVSGNDSIPDHDDGFFGV